MRLGLGAIEDFDWVRLEHACGPAGDTPSHLRALGVARRWSRRSAPKAGVDCGADT